MDAVVVWSDTEGKEYRSKRLQYLKEYEDSAPTAETCRRLNELMASIAAILKFLDFVERIFLVTDTPHVKLMEFVKAVKNKAQMTVISHEELYGNFSGFLPCFSSTAVRTILYRINDMSEEFLLFECGCIPIRKMTEDEFRTDGTTCLFGHMERTAFLGRRKTFLPYPTPVILSKAMIKECLAANHGILLENLKHRFNDKSQQDILKIILDSGIPHQNCQMSIVSLKPDSDAKMIEKLASTSDKDFLFWEPMHGFSPPQKQALLDYLAVLLRVSVPFQEHLP